MVDGVQLIYKILTPNQWARFQQEKTFAGSAVDHEDGYIHFSTASQVTETAARHFGDQSEIWVLAFDVASFGDDLKWEPSRGGQLFPHLYAQCSIEMVAGIQQVFQSQGRFHFEL